MSSTALTQHVVFFIVLLRREKHTATVFKIEFDISFWFSELYAANFSAWSKIINAYQITDKWCFWDEQSFLYYLNLVLVQFWDKMVTLNPITSWLYCQRGNKIEVYLPVQLTMYVLME